MRKRSASEHERADWDGPGVQGLAVRKVDDLQTAAADVDEETVFGREAVDRPEKGQAGFVLRVDEGDVQVEFVAQALNEGLAVRGAAHGGGRDGGGANRSRAARDGREVFESVQGPLEGGGAELSAAADLEGETQRSTLLVNDFEMSPGFRLHDDDAPGIGTDVDNGDAAFHGGQRSLPSGLGER